MFDSTVTNSLKVENATGNIKNAKYRFCYNYKNLYRYIIVEDEKLNNTSLNDITVLNTNINLKKSYIESSEGFETWEGNKHFTITSNLYGNFSNKLTLNFNNESKISKYNSLNSLSFKGLFEIVLFENENRNNQYLLKYDKMTESEIIFYKPNNKLYFILIIPFSDKINLQNGTSLLRLK